MRSYYKDLRVDYMDGHEKMNTDRKNRHMVSKYFQMKMHVDKIQAFTYALTIFHAYALNFSRVTTYAYSVNCNFLKEFQKRNWESKTILFNNPSIPVIYPTSGLEVEPNGVIINIPIKIIKVSDAREQ